MLTFIIIDLLGFFDLMFSIFESRSNKNNSPLPRLAPFKAMVLEGLLTLRWFSLCESFENFSILCQSFLEKYLYQC